MDLTKMVFCALLQILSIASAVSARCALPQQWRATGWKLNENSRRTFNLTGTRVYTGSQYEDWTCEDFAPNPSGSRWTYLVLSSNSHGVRCHRVYQDINYMVFWTASHYPGSSAYSAGSCEELSLYDNTQPDILISEALERTGQGCFGTIRGYYHAQVSLSERQRDICSDDVISSVAEIESFDLRLETCAITGTLRCVGQVFAEYIGDAGADTAIFFQNATHPSIYYCARMRNDRDANRIFLSVDYTPRDRVVCDTQRNALSAADTPTAQLRAFSLMRLFCTGRNPCENGGTCTEQNGISFRCACASGYGGVTCSDSLFCVPNPCLNDGVCREGGTSHICDCKAGYAGQICETAACEEGTRLDADYPNLCLICPVGTYQPQRLADACIPCPAGTTTQQERSTSASQCVPNCPPGEYISGRTCMKCGRGQYQPLRAQSTCIACPAGHVTTQRGSHSMEQCILINPCESNPCVGGATCHADVNGYRCACPDFKGGLHCQKDTVPKISGIEPSFGPIAGGTVITVTGRFLQGHSQLQVLLGGKQCTVLSRNGTHILLQTPNFNPDTPESQFRRKSFDIELKYTPTYPVEMPQEFTYLPNPVIDDVIDLNTIATGGSAVTGTGRHVDSVANPLLLVTLIYKSVRNTFPRTAQVITKHYTGPCFDSTATKLRCFVPELPLPEDIEAPQLVRKRRSMPGSLLRHVTKRSSGDVRVFEGCDGRRGAPEEVEFYVDFVMDSAAAFLQEKKELCVFKDPFLEEFDPPVQQYKRNERLEIMGTNMDLGLTNLHYSIDIGKGHCDDIELLSNSLSCKPPKSKPDVVKTGNYKKNAPRVVIRVGENFRFQAGYLEYPDFNSVLIPVVAASIALVCFIVLLIAVLCYCHKRKAATKASKQGAAIQNNVRKNSSANPLYTPTEDDNNNAVFVNVDSYLPPNTRMRQNSVYDVTSSTQVRLPSGSSDNSDDFATIFVNGEFGNPENYLISANGRSMNTLPNRGARKASVPTIKTKAKRHMEKRRSATVPNRKKKTSTGSKKTNLGPIRESKNSKRFRKEVDKTTANGHVVPNGDTPNEDITQEYIRPIFLTDGTVSKRAYSGSDSVRAHINGRTTSSPPYSVT